VVGVKLWLKLSPATCTFRSIRRSDGGSVAPLKGIAKVFRVRVSELAVTLDSAWSDRFPRWDVFVRTLASDNRSSSLLPIGCTDRVVAGPIG